MLVMQTLGIRRAPSLRTGYPIKKLSQERKDGKCVSMVEHFLSILKTYDYSPERKKDTGKYFC